MTLYPGTVRPVIRRDDWGNLATTAATSFTRASATYVGMPNPMYLVITIQSTTATVSSVSGLGGSWSRVTQMTQGTIRQEIWVNTTGNTATGTITINMSASVRIMVSSYVFENADLTAPGVSIDQVGGSTTAIGSGTVTTTEDNQVVAEITHTFTTASTNITVQSVAPPQLATPTSRQVATALPVMTVGSDHGYFFADWTNIAVQSYGAGTSIGWSGVLSAAADWITARLVIRGARIDMTDYSYKYTDTGILLNNATGSPIYDIEKVSGLTDINIDAESSDYDGATGGYTFAKFMSQKTIVLEGTVYVTPFTESVADNFRANFVPVSSDQPFHFVHPGNPRRMIYCKPIGLKADIDQGRARGVMPFQITLQAADPRIYDTSEMQILSLGTSTVTPNGTTETFPVVWFWVTAAEISAANTVSFNKIGSPNRAVTIDCSKLTGGEAAYRIDFAARRLTSSNGLTDYTNALTLHDWWALTPGAQTINYTRSSSVADKAALFWQEAYV